MSREVVILEQAAQDLEAGMEFYERVDPGAGGYFRDSMMAELRRLARFPGTHSVHFGFHRALTQRFPFGIYYHDDSSRRMVVAVLDLRRSPAWLRSELDQR